MVAAGVKSCMFGGGSEVPGTVTAAAAVCNLMIAIRVSMTIISRVAWSHIMGPAPVIVAWGRLAAGKREVGVGAWYGAWKKTGPIFVR